MRALLCKLSTRVALPPFTHADLLCGMGGFSAAARLLGGETVVAGDICPAAKRTFQRNHPSCRRWFDDVHSPFVEQAVPARVDVLTCGFPCQPFSDAGHRKGLDDPRAAVLPRLGEILSTRKPRAVLLENVEGIFRASNGRGVEVVRSTLRSAGYHLAAPFVASAEDYGCAAKRTRVYFVAFRSIEALRRYTPPVPILPRGPAEEVEAREGFVPGPFGNVRQAAADADATMHTSSKSLGVVRAREAKHRKKYLAVVKDVEVLPTLVTNCTGVQVRVAGVPRGGTCPCRDGELPRGFRDKTPCSGMRRLSVLEMALAMGFPRTYHLVGTKTEQRRLVGNSVSVPVVRAMMGAVVAALHAAAAAS